eukprot:TRINITY_DN2137_c0_g1_i8.p1 TRINITY_DN2137_c0_g1~~TRINITY_DN2137_c0_g1_i8.p1  ORF type:complete len:324 (-),score=38.71 TRINITY_DN2137_c0_g1_i8:193-1164(-)
MVELYNDFVKEFQDRMDQVVLLRLVAKITPQLPNLKSRLEFVDKLKELVLRQEQALILAELRKGFHLLEERDIEACNLILQESSKKVDRIREVDPFLYSQLYKLQANYHHARKEYQDFYKNALQFLAYTPEDEITPEEKISFSLEMGLAILFSPKILNFSELLEQRVIQSLQGSQYVWLYNLLEIFNRGDVTQFTKHMSSIPKEIQQHTNAFVDQRTTLEQKIRIASMFELIFNLQKNERNLTFEQLSTITHLSVSEVEFLIIKAMSLELIKGEIDQVEQRLDVSWIQPRVLDLERVKKMKNKVDSWVHSLEALLRMVQEYNI